MHTIKGVFTIKGVGHGDTEDEAKQAAIEDIRAQLDEGSRLFELTQTACFYDAPRDQFVVAFNASYTKP